MVKPKESFELAIHESSLSSLQKSILRERYLRVLRHFEQRCFRIALLFHTTRFIVTVGSLLVPALLSIQYSDTSNSTTIQDPDSFAYEIYWATWVISLLVTTSNGVLSTFKVDKKYYFLHTTLEFMRSEGWQYFQLSGRYNGHYTPGLKATHENQFVHFCHAVERMKIKQVEEEYYKLTDSHSNEKAKTVDAGKEKKESTLPFNPLLEGANNGQSEMNLPELLKQTATAPKLPSEKEEKA